VTLRPRVLTPPPASEELDLATLYRKHAQKIARWAGRLGGPDCDVEDVVHEVFIVAQRRLPEFRGDAEISTWLYCITENTVRHRRRKEKWRRWLGGSANDVAGRVESARPTPIEALESRRATELVYRALDGIPEKYRGLLILFELEQLTGEEIARLTGIKLATVWVRLHRARAMFLSRLEAIEGRKKS
jgi:RNA polymerase sigma-70 factor (ECF subfamily)